MKKKRCASAVLAAALSMSVLLAGCSSSSVETTAASGSAETSAAGAETEAASGTSAPESKSGAAASGSYNVEDKPWEQTFEADGKDYPQMTIKQGTIGNMSDIASTPGCQGFALFKNFMEGRSGGKIKVEIYDNSVLGGDEDMLEQVGQGSLQLDTPMTSNLITYDEEFGAMELPFLFQSSDQVIRAMKGDLGKYYEDKLDPSTGIKIVGSYYNGARSMTNSVRPINTVDDMKGLKMRVMNNDVYIKMMEALGANPTPISWNELFTALQQGTVDGEENPPSTIYPSGFAEVQKYFSQTEHVYGYALVVTNSEWYSGLDADTKALFDEGIEKMTELANTAELALGDYYIKEMSEDGMECNTITAENRQGFVDATQSVRDEYRNVYSSDLWAILDKVIAE